VLPVDNLSGGPIPSRDLQVAVEQALAAAGVAVLPAPAVGQFLARHRIRWTGGLDAEAARAAGAELGVAFVLVTSVEAYDPAAPKMAFGMRLVTADAGAQIRWIDEAGRRGDDDPGPFDLRVVRDPAELQRQLLAKLAGSLSRALSGGAPEEACGGNGRFAPKQSFRSPRLDAGRTTLVAVLPFVNETARKSAGEILALQFARELQESGRIRVLEPGVVREDLLRFRIVMEGGVSLDAARVILQLTRADAVLTGFVREFTDAGPSGAPEAQFTAMLLSRDDSEVVWESTSYSHGDDGVFFFDLGLVSTAPALTCRMVQSSVHDLLTPHEQPPRSAR
jgi:hypothetical protein